MAFRLTQPHEFSELFPQFTYKEAPPAPSHPSHSLASFARVLAARRTAWLLASRDPKP